MQQNSSPHRADGFPIGFKEFVALMAALMALNALAIDSMLPALPAIGERLSVHDENSRQWIVSAYLIGIGIGALFYGSLSDRFGRKPVLMVTAAAYAFCALLCAGAQSFTWLIAARFAQGFFAAATRVLAVSIVRDRFHGDQMARIMSLTFIVFMAVPILAPSIGQGINLLFGWRAIFIGLALLAGVVMLWVHLRLPETLDPADAIPIHPVQIMRTWGTVIFNRSAFGYMAATGFIMGALFGFINSVQQIFFDIFRAPDIFPIAFAGMAAMMGVGSFFNSRIVERFGARRVSHSALFAFIFFGGLHTLVATSGNETMWTFVVLQAFNTGMVAFTGSNFGSIAMQPFGRMAGAASSFQACATTILSALIGAWIGQHFNGTTVPLALGYFLCGVIALAIVWWADEWKLFTRRNPPQKPVPQAATPARTAMP